MYKGLFLLLFWGLGIGDWGLGQSPNPQSPIPKFSKYMFKLFVLIYNKYYNNYNNIIT